MNIFSGRNFKRHRKTQKFHVGKGKCLVRATEREMSVWSMEMSANLQDMRQKWNPNECKVIYVRKGKQVEHAANLKLDETTLVEKLKTGTKYKFLGVRQPVKEDEKLALKVAAKTYLERLSIIWTSPLYDANRVKATNQFALLVLIYPMWTQQWPLGELQSTDRETRKLISENCGRHPLSSTALLKQTSNQRRQLWSRTLRMGPSTSSWV